VPSFEFSAATRIVFGAGAIAALPGIARQLGDRALVVRGRRPDAVDRVLPALAGAGVASVQLVAAGEPALEDVRDGVRQARAEACRLVIAVGGGSVIDTGKAIAVLVENPGDPLEYLEVVGEGHPLARPGLPLVAVPTTAGSGAEVTRNAVLASRDARVKASLRSPWMAPRVALVDPELTYLLPPALTASTGLDALAQLVEPYLSRRATAMTDMFCREGIPRIARALPLACREGRNVAAREDMAFASLLGGLSLAHAGLGAVHGLAGPIGGRFPAPHGAVCAALLPHVLMADIRALRLADPEGPALGRCAHVARWLTGREGASAEEAVDWLLQLDAELQVPTLGVFGVTPDDIGPLVEQACRSSSIQSNPVVLSSVELGKALRDAL
jgi:alcohol dehydrogenase class IV